MKVSRLRLSNFKCYASADVTLPGGVTVVYGPNGAGKSSLLEAVFFALYGAIALDATLDDIVTRGAEDAEVELWFSHGDGEYRVERRIRATGDRAQTATCILETPEGPIEGATDVGAAIGSLLRMDSEAFVNCAYVRQGEVNKLVNATPKERQAMLDELLQLGTLEVYRQRAGQGRLAVRSVREIWADRLERKEEEIEALEDQELHGRLNAFESELAEIDERVESFEENRDRAREALTEAKSVLSAYEEKQSELSEVVERIESAREKIAETERERESIAAEIEASLDARAELQDRIESTVEASDIERADDRTVDEALHELANRRDEVQEALKDRSIEVSEHESEAERLEERANDRAERAEKKREAATELETEAAELTRKAEDVTERLEAIEVKIEELRGAFADVPVDPGGIADHLASCRETLEDTRENAAEVREELAPIEARIEDAETLLAEGKCPECGQPVDGSPHVDAIEDHRERKQEFEKALAEIKARQREAAERVEQAEMLRSTADEIDDLETERARLNERRDELLENADEQRENAATAREAATERANAAAEIRESVDDARARAKAARETVGELNAELAELRERIDHLEALADTIAERETIDDRIERLREKRSDRADRNEERRETLETMRERKRRLESAYDDDRIEEANAKRDRAEEYLARVESELKSLGERRDELVGEIESTRGKLDRLEELREEHEALEERVEALITLHEEAQTLEELYSNLRAELRRQNVASLERLLNESFDLIYQNDAYARIELDDDYGLTVYQKDGETLDPAQLSGGERALFNLSLRAAIYRLISEGIEGVAPMPPLILDEPTVFLDAGHVAQLVELVESMRNLGVEQIVVVSHDEELVGAADELLTVRKDATTNRSTVERGVQHTALAD